MRFLNGLWFVEGPLFFQSVSSKDDSVTVFPVRISSERFSTQTVSSDVWIDQHQFCWTACERVQMDLSQHLSSASGSPLSSPLPPFSCLWRWLVWVGHVVLVGSCIQTTRVALTRAACLKKKQKWSPSVIGNFSSNRLSVLVGPKVSWMWTIFSLISIIDSIRCTTHSLNVIWFLLLLISAESLHHHLYLPVLYHFNNLPSQCVLWRWNMC